MRLKFVNAESGFQCYCQVEGCNHKPKEGLGHVFVGQMLVFFDLDDGLARNKGFGRWMCPWCVAAAINLGLLSVTLNDGTSDVVESLAEEEPTEAFEVSW